MRSNLQLWIHECHSAHEDRPEFESEKQRNELKDFIYILWASPTYLQNPTEANAIERAINAAVGIEALAATG